MESKNAHRPFGVTLLIAVVLIFTSLNLLQAITALQQRTFLSTLPLQVPLSYLIITGAIWSVLGLVLVFGLLTRKRWSLPLAMILFLAYPAAYWIDWLLIAEGEVVNNRWQFALGLTFLIVVPALWILKKPGTKQYLNQEKPRSNT